MEFEKKRLLAGVAVPDTDLVGRALAFAESKCEPYLFNHVVRSWLFAASIASISKVEHDPEVLAIGTLLHDVTLNTAFRGPRRFEVEAADIARTFAVDAGMDSRRTQLVWDCVALNSTPIDRPLQGTRGFTLHRRYLFGRRGSWLRENRRRGNQFHHHRPFRGSISR